ncbi:MAG: GCN5-related N-acetyltransferase [Lacrimispora sp.]|jgi:RimJ/RimL family protein N-acetyltransferase|nr:GCN5-related N-acetyltransferase [Lacrimispora sp.]
MEISTERLCLRKYDKSCINDYYRLKSCSVVWDYSPFVPVFPEFWNQGFATEIATKLVLYAINDLNYERVEALVLTDNKASCRVMEKAGFKCEGILRYFNKHEDNYRDVNYYGIISSDIKLI